MKNNPYENTLKKLQQLAQESRQRNAGDIKPATEQKEEKITLEKAREIIGDENFYGPKEITETFNIKGWENSFNIPEIQFSKEDLERAKELGQELILYVHHDARGNFLTVKRIKELCGTPFKEQNRTSKGETFVASTWFETDSIASKETPRLGWRLSGKEAFKGSENKNYIQQTEAIIEYLKQEVFPDGFPLEYQEAVSEFDSVKETLRTLSESDKSGEWKLGTEKLAELKINQMCRENFAEVIYRLALHEKKTGERLLDPSRRDIYYTWTNSRASGGSLVSVGRFASGGADVDGWTPGRSGSSLGVCFSRS